jgi:hypothetical protein
MVVAKGYGEGEVEFVLMSADFCFAEFEKFLRLVAEPLRYLNMIKMANFM